MVVSGVRLPCEVFLLVALIVGGSTVVGLGRHVDLFEAVQVAPELAKLGGAASRGGASAEIASIEPLVNPRSCAVVGYVVRLTSSDCLVLSAETRLPPLIAYGFDRGLPSDTEGASLVLAMAAFDLSMRAEALELGIVSEELQRAAERQWGVVMSGAPTASAAGAPLGPLIEAPTWGQSAPWNERCPLDSTTGERSLSGCVATALAQVLAYWRSPGRVLLGPSDDYQTATRGAAIDASDASLASVTYSSTAWRNPADSAMRDLVWAAGVSVRTDYTSSASGALLVDAAVALAGSSSPYASNVRPAVWGYASADVRTCANSSWGSPFYEPVETFYAELRDDLRQGRPVLLCISSLQSRAGHVLICDGYDPVTGAYHLNLGWGGNGDAWYALPDDIPGGYNVVEYGVLHIEPGDDEEAVAPLDEAEEEVMALGPDGSRLLVYPNPTWGPAEFRWDISWKSTDSMIARVDVFTLAGQLVWSSGPGSPEGITWSGLGVDETPVSRGVYLCVMTVISGTGVDRVRSTLLVEP